MYDCVNNGFSRGAKRTDCTPDSRLNANMLRPIALKHAHNADQRENTLSRAETSNEGSEADFLDFFSSKNGRNPAHPARSAMMDVGVLSAVVSNVNVLTGTKQVCMALVNLDSL